MTDDPIVDEVHMVRAKIFEECDRDIGKLLDRLRTREAQDEDRLVSSVEEARKREPG